MCLLINREKVLLISMQMSNPGCVASYPVLIPTPLMGCLNPISSAAARTPTAERQLPPQLPCTEAHSALKLDELPCTEAHSALKLDQSARTCFTTRWKHPKAEFEPVKEVLRLHTPF